ncbi:N-acetyllactosaminide beta-1,3-N-acetylglucosaminyltransferase 3-like [Heptranchias perlo]|uniref:N-acetyllactosaminide beta-1,3-N-acetylglucosaminyltransferase 3-like n=1 Tax=Heptranchias perlo TaxID=212740 RepID=UPI003559406E
MGIHIWQRMRKQRRSLEKVALFVIGILALVFIFRSEELPRQSDEVSMETIQSSRLHNIIAISAEKPKLASTCKENRTVLDLPEFMEQPQHIQNYLKYKHCREFNIVQNVPDKCRGRERSQDVFLLLVIKSDPFNHDRRDMVRKTWGKERKFRGVQIRRVFISAVTPNQRERRKLNRLLAMENREHQDILQWDFLDTFFNLSSRLRVIDFWTLRVSRDSGIG